MPNLVLHSLEVEEALITALLLHDDFAGLEEFTDDELWYDHLRPVVAMVRKLHAAGKPCGIVFVLVALQPVLDDMEWRGDRGEVMLVDLLSRHLTDVQAYYGRQLGRLVRHYAKRRAALQEAQGAATRTFAEVLDRARASYGSEL
jgi:hypothetical protein